MTPLRLVLLPGLDGTATLFEPLRHWLRRLPETIALPTDGPQDHASLAEALHRRLLDDSSPFVLLGESFSGAIAHRIALQAPPGLRGVIFAASFLQCPRPLLRWLGALPLPRTLLLEPLLLRALCLDAQAPDATLDLLARVIGELPEKLLRARLATLAQMKPPLASLALPALQLAPTRDRLLSQRAVESVGRYCTDLQRQVIPGPHFLLQARPQACASAIEGFLDSLEKAPQRGAVATSPGFP